jgi:hypothetical protein
LNKQNKNPQKIAFNSLENTRKNLENIEKSELDDMHSLKTSLSLISADALLHPLKDEEFEESAKEIEEMTLEEKKEHLERLRNMAFRKLDSKKVFK